MASLDSDVAILGGGVAGLAVANALAQRGLRSVVLEKRRAPGEIDRGDVIQDSVLPILERWGLADRLAAYGPIQLRKFRMLDDRARTLFEVDLEHDLPRAARLTLVTHPDLERLLEQAARDSGCVRVCRELPGVDLLVEGGRVRGVRTEGEVVRAPLTVIATGAQAPLRDRYFPPRDVHDYPFSFYNARVKLVPAFADAGFYVLGRTGILVMAPLPHGEMRIGIQFTRTAGGEGISSRNFAEMVVRRFPAFPMDQLEFRAGHVYHLSRSLARSLSIPGAVLAGDAAHTVHPAGGQGMNLAFQDADLLAELLGSRERLARTDALDQACGAYSDRRKREVRRVLRVTHFMGFLGALERPTLQRARAMLLKACNRSRPFKRYFVQRVIDVG